MAEVLEYALVFLTSSLIVGFSLGAYSAYYATLEHAQGGADFSSMVTVAMASIQHGTSAITLSLNNATVSCQSSDFVFSSSSYSATHYLPAGCNFRATNLTGTRTLTFRFMDGVISLVVE